MRLGPAILLLPLSPLCALAMPSDWDCSLSLDAHRAAQPPLFQVVQPDDLRPLPELKALPEPKKDDDDLSGFDINPVYTEGSTVEYRTGLGIGAGFATNSSWAVSQTVSVSKGLDVSVYYLRAMGEAPRLGGHHVGAETDPTTPSVSAGFRLEWKF
jgi:hypothetical protein